jgi:magnesium transporter
MQNMEDIEEKTEAIEATAEDEVTGVVDRILELLEDEEQLSPDFSFVLELDDDCIGQVIESIPWSIRLSVWAVLPPDRYWPVLRSMQHSTVGHVVDSLPAADVEKLTELAEDADLLALADCLPQQMVDAILEEVGADRAEILNEALAYEEDQVGRYIDRNVIKVRPAASVQRLVKRLRLRGGDRPVAIFVVDRTGAPVGHITYDMLMGEGAAKTVGELAGPVSVFKDSDDFYTAMLEIESSDNSAWYPVMRDGKLLGAISAWVLLREWRDQNLDTLIRETPADEEDLFTPVPKAAQIRALWLMINLATAFLASAVIGMFESALREVVALAVLMPVVASMGGIAGSQTLAISLRGLALNHLSEANLNLVLAKEAKIALLNGLVLGVIVGLVVWSWFDSASLGAIIFAAILVNGLAAAYAGTFIPFMLKKMRIDPAISGSVILTTVTDVVGFIVFLGLGSLVFLDF